MSTHLLNFSNSIKNTVESSPLYPWNPSSVPNFLCHLPEMATVLDLVFIATHLFS